MVRLLSAIVGPTPPLSKIDSLEGGGGGVPKILLERGKGGKGGCHFFITLQFNCIYSVCEEGEG